MKLSWICVTFLSLLAVPLFLPEWAGQRTDNGTPRVKTNVALEVDFQAPTTPVSPILHGLMTEEINYSYDGGLYAELIRNRVFRDDPNNQPVHWSVVKQAGTGGSIRVVNTHPLTDKLPGSLEVDIKTATPEQRVRVVNDGYWGVPIKPATTYRASFYIQGDRPAGKKKFGGFKKGVEPAPFTGTLTVALVSADGSQVYAAAETPAVKPQWQHFEVPLTTSADVQPTASGRFVISAGSTGRFWLSLVSLFPPTYKNRPNGLRVDIMEKLAAMKPKFIRFPGGNYVEGDTLWERFDWKATVGPLPFRAGHRSPWNYRSSDGMGLLEFMGWCEDLGAQPVLAVFAGYALRQQAVEPGPLLEPYVQDALDEIEFITGNAQTSYWGKLRARYGHEAPFKLTYVEIGNEDYFDRSRTYEARFSQFYDAIKAKYPHLQLIATSRKVKTRTPDIWDDHYYRNSDGFFKDLHHYDKESRKGPKVMVGEWATREGSPTPNFQAALGDAAWMTMMERNSDLIIMHCYAPLFVNVNPGGMQWKTDLIGYNGLESYGSPAYYAQVMFANHIGDVTLKSALRADSKVLLPYCVSRQTATGKVFLKVVNPGAAAQTVNIRLKRVTNVEREGKVITLRATGPTDTNSITEPTKIVPLTEALKNVAPSFDYTFPAWSITVLELNTARASSPAKAGADPLAPEAMRERIQKHRTAAAVLTVLGADGKPLANAPVVIRQTRHKFLFGSNGFGLVPSGTAESQVAYRQRFAALFNYATLPFYWGSYEPRQGEPREPKLRQMAQWCQEKGISVKGHPLCWHEVSARWLNGQTPEETLSLQLGRIRREVSTFAGLVHVWDVVNEEVSMPDSPRANAITRMCRKIGQVPLLEKTFAAARAADPHAVLALNDFDTSPKYEKLIQDALAAGVSIDVIGIQSHMHAGFWGASKTWDFCERFGRLGRPLHFSEVTIVSGPPRKEFDYDKDNRSWTSTPECEKQQAEQVEQFYTVLFSHPMVEGITWWDFSDRGAWLGAPAGLLRNDMVPKPAYEVLLKLIQGEWWTREVKATTDSAGRVSFRGFLGSYAVDTSAGRGVFSLDKAGEARVTTQVKAR